MGKNYFVRFVISNVSNISSFQIFNRLTNVEIDSNYMMTEVNIE